MAAGDVTQCQRFRDAKDGYSIPQEFWRHGPGAFLWINHPEWDGDTILIILPRVLTIHLPVAINLPHHLIERPVWQWNGDREAPTLETSIFSKNHDVQWHGYLTDGVLKET